MYVFYVFLFQVVRGVGCKQNEFSGVLTTELSLSYRDILDSDFRNPAGTVCDRISAGVSSRNGNQNRACDRCSIALHADDVHKVASLVYKLPVIRFVLLLYVVMRNIY